MLSSQEYARTANHLSHCVPVTYFWNGKGEQYVAKVKMFLELQPPMYATELKKLHMVVADLYNAQVAVDGKKRLQNLLKAANLK